MTGVDSVPERETPLEAAERELLAVREDVRRLDDRMRAELEQQDGAPTTDE